MKKKLIIFFIFISIVNIFSQETYYKVINRTTPQLPPDSESALFPGEIVFPDFSNTILLNNSYALSCNSEKFTLKGCAYIASVDLEFTSMNKLNEEIMIPINFSYPISKFFIPYFYLKILKTNDKNSMALYSKYNKNIESERFYTEKIYFDSLFFKFVPNGNLASDFFYLNINYNDYFYYKLYVIPNIELTRLEPHIIPSKYLDFFETGKPVTLYLHHNQNKLRVYLDGKEEPIWDLIKVSADFNKALESFLQYNQWPLTTKWQDMLQSDIFEEWPVTPLSQIKEQFKIQRPKEPEYFAVKKAAINSIPFNSPELKIGEVIPDQKLYLLESGTYAILDDVKAPWLHIETEANIRGWVWGGFLKELNPYVFPGTHKVLDTLRLRQEASQTSVAIAILRTDDLVILLETGKTETIDGISAPWVKVENEKGQVGWCFSGYLEALEKEIDGKQEAVETSEAANGNVTAGLPGNVLVILIAAGALLFGALVFFLIRKKT